MIMDTYAQVLWLTCFLTVFAVNISYSTEYFLLLVTNWFADTDENLLALLRQKLMLFECTTDGIHIIHDFPAESAHPIYHRQYCLCVVTGRSGSATHSFRLSRFF